MQLVWFGLIGILGGLVGLLYAKGFYGMAAFFSRLTDSPLGPPGDRWPDRRLHRSGHPRGARHRLRLDPAGLGAQLLHIPLWIVLILPFARIATTGLSIGSGGSGGIFGPGMVIGAFVGAAVWRLLSPSCRASATTPPRTSSSG